MNEYTDEWAREQQALAFDGDEDACWRLIVLVKGFCLSQLKRAPLEQKEYDEVWSECIRRLAVRMASGNTIDAWDAYAKRVVLSVIATEIRRDKCRERAKEEYMERRRVRYTEAYPAVRECVELLEELPHDLIHRVYFRPVRQSLLGFSLEYDMNYWRVKALHSRTLDRLRAMLIERGVCHA